MRFTLLIILLIYPYVSDCQNIRDVDKWIDYIENLDIEDRDKQNINMLYDELSYLSLHPFDINTVTKDKLKQLPFLTDHQIDAIISFRNKYGPLVSIYEFKNIEYISLETIHLLLPFVDISYNNVYKKKISLKSMLKYSKNEIQIRYNKCFQIKDGYKEKTNNHYIGEPFYNVINFKQSFINNIDWGVIVEKDAGESLFKGKSKGYDYYSGYFFIEDKSIFKTIVLGDYKAAFGQGLVLSHDFIFSKSMLMKQGERRHNGFRKHNSTNEYNFFRGLATTININKIDLSIFYSNRKLDATVKDGFIETIKKDGLHRSINEIEKKGIFNMQSIGGNIRYILPNFNIGLTGLYYKIKNYCFAKSLLPYRLFYFTGNKQTNISVDYMLKNNNIKFYGETAINTNKNSIASLNALHIQPVSYFSFLLMHRYYDKSYNSFYSNAYGQNNNNEKGIYAGLYFTPFSYWSITAYADFYKKPWVVYSIDYPSSYKKYGIEITNYATNKIKTSIRYKKNDTENYYKDYLRLQYTNEKLSNWTFKTVLNSLKYNSKIKNKNSYGWMVSQDCACNIIKKNIRYSMYIAYFSTDDYNSRIYSYERNILYAFNMPSFYGKGIRLSTTFKYKISRIEFSAKLAHTIYTDRDNIGSGLELINGSYKTDLYTLFRFLF